MSRDNYKISYTELYIVFSSEGVKIQELKIVVMVPGYQKGFLGSKKQDYVGYAGYQNHLGRNSRRIVPS